MNDDKTNDNRDDDSNDTQSIIAGRRPSKKNDISEEINIDENVLTESNNIETNDPSKNDIENSEDLTILPSAESSDDVSQGDESSLVAEILDSTSSSEALVNNSEFLELKDIVLQQGRILEELRAGLLSLGGQLDRSTQLPRLGMFVDVPNLIYGQDSDSKPLHMGKLLQFIGEGRDVVRATAYSPVSDDPMEALEQQKFVAPFVPYEYRIVTKALKRFADGSIKGNFDVEMAIDMLTMADGLDVIAVVSGDADFARAVEVVQTRGVRVEVFAFAQSSSLEMRSLADRYVELGSVLNQIV